ncbi:MAG TPA: TadE family protein [Actinomycetota bacterium]|nr:TadE family protein [Actinomycetota bacterium]
MLRDEAGSAPLETVFAVVMLTILTLGALQVAFALYARNVVSSAAHEGARALAERGATGATAEAVAASVVERSAGGLVDDLRVHVATSPRGDATVIRVEVAGKTAPFGPVPVAVPLSAAATSVVEVP